MKNEKLKKKSPSVQWKEMVYVHVHTSHQKKKARYKLITNHQKMSFSLNGRRRGKLCHIFENVRSAVPPVSQFHRFTFTTATGFFFTWIYHNTYDLFIFVFSFVLLFSIFSAFGVSRIIFLLRCALMQTKSNENWG